MKNNKGITLISLIVTIVMVLIIASISISSINSAPDTQGFSKMKNDITSLKDKTLIYYNKYGEAPIIENKKIEQGRLNNIKLEGTDTGDNYYEIDLSKLENITLNFGDKKNGNENDVYIINSKTLEIFYLEGTKLNEKMHYSI